MYCLLCIVSAMSTLNMNFTESRIWQHVWINSRTETSAPSAHISLLIWLDISLLRKINTYTIDNYKKKINFREKQLVLCREYISKSWRAYGRLQFGPLMFVLSTSQYHVNGRRVPPTKLLWCTNTLLARLCCGKLFLEIMSSTVILLVEFCLPFFV